MMRYTADEQAYLDEVNQAMHHIQELGLINILEAEPHGRGWRVRYTPLFLQICAETGCSKAELQERAVALLRLRKQGDIASQDALAILFQPKKVENML